MHHTAPNRALNMPAYKHVRVFIPRWRLASSKPLHCTANPTPLTLYFSEPVALHIATQTIQGLHVAVSYNVNGRLEESSEDAYKAQPGSQLVHCVRA